ncbi:MAG: Uma2 family endonuclease [Isosphaerales bacterium]
MATVTKPTRVLPRLSTRARIPTAVAGEQRIVIRGLSWDLYDRLSDAVGEGQHVHLTYDGKDLELMTTGRMHEVYKELFGWFMRFVTSELRIRCRPLGQTTWKRPEIARGLEADQCYYFTPKKIKAELKGLAKKSNKIADYPNPDLAIEIDISPSQVDRTGIYAALKVPEVWRFDGESLVIGQLSRDGTYTTAEKSLFLPVRAEEVCRWVAQEDSSDELAWEQRLREWARTELAPRLNA